MTKRNKMTGLMALALIALGGFASSSYAGELLATCEGANPIGTGHGGRVLVRMHDSKNGEITEYKPRMQDDPRSPDWHVPVRITRHKNKDGSASYYLYSPAKAYANTRGLVATVKIASKPKLKWNRMGFGGVRSTSEMTCN